MNKINDCFNNTFDNIKLSKSQSNDLNQRIILGYKKRKRNKKIIFSILVITSMILVGTGITYAEEIKEIVTSIFTKSYTEKIDNNEVQKIKLKYNGVKKINKSVDKFVVFCWNY